MARPRIFISSTFYDLKHVRGDIAQFVKEKGYDTILFERGEIPYGKDERPEEYCYQEIDMADILVCLIGGRYGSESYEGDHSVTQKELKYALDKGKQVYIFVDKNVQAEYETFKLNKDNPDMKYRYVDNQKVYEFLDEIFHLPRNNSVFGFESSQDIIVLLKEQWAGLFQRLLRQEEEKSQLEIIQSLKGTVSTLENMVNLIMQENKNQESKFEEIILFNHPAFDVIKEKLKIKHRVTFISITELNDLIVIRGYKRIEQNPFANNDYYVWERVRKEVKEILKVHKSLFDESGKIKPIHTTLDKNMIIKEQTQISISDDDLPF